ncbi:30S ribosomal protein S20 [uncultured Mailhella sp.]|uniref:30S ribosomal protein S20 n=1 Tax=uncultured Mailhella sp. TaxID=1981031 RepID=UPI0026051C6F|nr:30S ribosomal protein S20 [uncultured Mailhella sp.]
MANHASAVKRQKQNVKRNARNRAARTRIKNVVKAVRAAVQNKDKAAAEKALVTATSTVSKIAGKGVIHWKNAARKVSRLARAVNALD